MSGLIVLLLVFSAVTKIICLSFAVEGFVKLGWPERLALPIGILELSCALLYLLPYTAVLGAILLTGYLGGAIATHLRVEEQFFVQAALGVVVWLGLYLREPRLRVLIPLRKP